MRMKKLLHAVIYCLPKQKVIVGILFLLGLLAVPNKQLLAQVNGLITEKATGRQLEGVNVAVKNEKTGTTTNNAGRFLIKVDNPQKAILVFSLVGYKSVEVQLLGKTVIDVQMEDSTVMMESVVINALGFETKRDKLGYANSKINGDQVCFT